MKVWPRSVFDMTYPGSATRRGRVQGGGKICPALMATQAMLMVYEGVEIEDETDAGVQQRDDGNEG